MATSDRKPKKVVAIDFGTSTTLVAVRPPNGIPEVIAIGAAPGAKLLPSIVDAHDPTIVGEDVNNASAHRSVKSDLTRAESEHVSEHDRRQAEVRVGAIIKEALRRAQERVPNLLRDSEVFVGCPALWSGQNRKRLATIVRELGHSIDFGNVLDEPVAAGISWIRDEWLQGGTKPVGDVLVFDPGGGTLDIAYLRVKENKDANLPDISILYADSIDKSGDFVDRLLVDRLCTNSPDLTAFKGEASLRDAARMLKEQLSFNEVARFNAGTPISRVVSCTQTDLEKGIEPFLKDMRLLIMNVVKGILLRSVPGITPYEIRTAQRHDFSTVLAPAVDYVVFAGGLSQSPVFEAEIRKMFVNAKIIRLGNPQEAVVRGLCYGQELVHLNLPRPPISFYARISYVDRGTLVNEEQCIYEAFSPLFRSEQALAGNGNVYKQWQCQAPVPATVEFYAVSPTVDDTVPTDDRLVAFKQTGSNTDPIGRALESSGPTTSDSFVRLAHSHDPRQLHGHVRFVIYPTAEIAFYGATHHMAARVENWSPTPGNFRIGEHLATSWLSYKLIKGAWLPETNVSVVHSPTVKSTDK